MNNLLTLCLNIQLLIFIYLFLLQDYTQYHFPTSGTVSGGGMVVYRLPHNKNGLGLNSPAGLYVLPVSE